VYIQDVNINDTSNSFAILFLR